MGGMTSPYKRMARKVGKISLDETRRSKMNKTVGFLLLTALACTVIPKAEAQYYSLYYPYYTYYPYSYYYYYPTYYALGKRSVDHKQVVTDQMTRMTRGTHQRVK